jgi:hypothetical protein
VLLQAFISGLGAGVLAAPHCAAMCGPLSMHACSRRARASTWRYQSARAAAYTTLGIVAGSTGAGLAAVLEHGWAAAALSWFVAVALLWSALGLWRGVKQPRPRPLGARTRPPVIARLTHRFGERPEVYGVITALLPCGVLLAAVALAAATASWVGGGLLMVGFALSSGVALAFAARAAQWLRQAGGGARRILAGVLVAGALVFVLRPLPLLLATSTGDRHPPGCPLHSGAIVDAASVPS